MDKMIRKNAIIIVIVVVTVVTIFYLHLLNDRVSQTVTEIDLSYDSSNSDMKSMLKSHSIEMSNPLRIHGDSIEKYCKFFSDVRLQTSVRYCTSTELVDSDRNFIGNIHMVGNAESPYAVLGIVQTNPFMSELDDVKIISQVMVNALVCECWEAAKPGGFDSVSEWIEAAKSHHLNAKKTTSKSEIHGLAHKQLLIEISTNTDGYLWKFVVSR